MLHEMGGEIEVWRVPSCDLLLRTSERNPRLQLRFVRISSRVPIFQTILSDDPGFYRYSICA